MAMEVSPEAMVMVVDKERYAEELRKWLECPICCDALFQPVHMGCEHLLCRGCVTQLDFYHKGKGLPPCPVCKQVPESTKLYPNSTNHMGLASICPIPEEYREPCRRCGLGNLTPAELMVHSIECTHRSVACEYGDKCRYTYEPLDVNSQHMYLNHIVKVHKGHISKVVKEAMDRQGGPKYKGHTLMIPRVETPQGDSKGSVIQQAMDHDAVTSDATNQIPIDVEVQMVLKRELVFWRNARKEAFIAARAIMDKRAVQLKDAEPSTQQRMSDALREAAVTNAAKEAVKRASPEVRGELMCSGLVTKAEARLMRIIAIRKAHMWARINRTEERMLHKRKVDAENMVRNYKRYTTKELKEREDQKRSLEETIAADAVAASKSDEHMNLDLPELGLGTHKEWHKAMEIDMPVVPKTPARDMKIITEAPPKVTSALYLSRLGKAKRKTFHEEHLVSLGKKSSNSTPAPPPRHVDDRLSTERRPFEGPVTYILRQQREDKERKRCKYST